MSYNLRSRAQIVKPISDLVIPVVDCNVVVDKPKRGRPKKKNVEHEKKVEEVVDTEVVEEVDNEEEFDDECEINKYIDELNEREIDDAVRNGDDLYEYILNEDRSATFVGHIDDNELVEESYEDSTGCTNFDSKQYYDDDNIDNLISQLDINIEKNVNLIFVKSSRGARKLIYDSYSYARDRGDIQQTQWKCDFNIKVVGENGKRKAVFCPGRCHTYNDRDIKIITEHNPSFHLPDPVLEECLKAKDDIKELAKNTSEKPRSIIKKCQVNLSQEGAAKMTRHQNLTQIIKRIRSTKPTYGPNAACIADLVVPEPLKFTFNNELFLWRDSGYGDEDRVFIFATENNLKLLSSFREWFMDGTFEVAPLIYKQMYNIAASISGKILPLLYSLLPNKTEKIYVKLFKLLDDIEAFQPPIEVVTDFELACTNALLSIWPYLIIFLCWFHYCQNLWKNMQLKKLSKDYVKDPLVRKLFKYLKFLPFVVPKDVVKAFKLIKSLGASCRKFDPMFTYFEKFYIGKLVKNSETIRQIPVYPIKRWNVVARVEQDKARTNNSLESWHFVNSKHILLFNNKFIDFYTYVKFKNIKHKNIKT